MAASNKKLSKKSQISKNKKALMFALAFGVIGVVTIIMSSAQSTQTYATNPHKCPNVPTLQYGMSGDCVKHVQWFLNNRDNYGGKGGAGITENGVFGYPTQYAVSTYQTEHNLKVRQLGVVDKATWNSLTKERTYRSIDRLSRTSEASR